VSTVIEVTSVVKRFGGATAVRGISFDIEAGSIMGLIGPNGSGKTTTLNLLNGVYEPDSGSIRLAGQGISGRSTRTFVESGVTRTFQHPRVFTSLTAIENMLVPVLHRRGGGRVWRSKALDLLGFVGLAAHASTPASELSGGQQKLLEFVRALMTDPKIVLMDEPFAGVHPSVKHVMRERIMQCHGEGTSFLIVSHEIPDLTRLCSQIICMSDGSIVSRGAPAEVVTDPEVIRAYLGQSAAADAAEAAQS
jgi:branched-chain amino acid transport system ATP-binding protein